MPSQCTTCRHVGHDWRNCVYQCVFCSGQHHGSPCPIFPGLYDVGHDDQATGLETLRKAKEAALAAGKRLDKNIATGETLQSQIAASEEDVAKQAGGPRPTEVLPEAGRNAALAAFGPGKTWKDIDPNFNSRPGREKKALREQWHREAMGVQPFAPNSRLEIVLRYHNRWPIRRGEDGFPISE